MNRKVGMSRILGEAYGNNSQNMSFTRADNYIKQSSEAMMMDYANLEYRCISVFLWSLQQLEDKFKPIPGSRKSNHIHSMGMIHDSIYITKAGK